MTGADLAVWESYSDLAGKRIEMADICRYLGTLNCRSVLWNCSYISVALQLGIVGELGVKENFSELLGIFFEPRLAAMLGARRWFKGEQRVVFHRRQILLLAKLALLHCREAGGIDTSRFPRALGITLLAVNDHFHFNTIPNGPIETYTREKLLGICTEFLVSKEFVQNQVQQALVRSHEMCEVIAPTMIHHPDYLDINSCLMSTTGANYSTLEALTFGAASRFVTGLSSTLVGNPGDLPLHASTFSKSHVPRRTLFSYLDHLSGSITQLRAEALRSADVSNDLSVFRKKPFVSLWFDVGTKSMRQGFLLLDQGLLFDKISSTPYWCGVSQFPEQFGGFWGVVFEDYVGKIMSTACDGTSARYIHSPRSPLNENEELCDGLVIVDKSVILLEYKSSMFTAKAKYGGDPTVLGRDIRKKLVFDDAKRKPKAAFQLAAAVKKLFNKEVIPSTPWIDLASVLRCYVVVITLDSIGGAIAISPLLNIDFQEQLAGTSLSCEVRPLYCLDVESLELATCSFTKATLTEILERWFQINPLLSTPLSAMRFEDWFVERPDWLKKRWDQLSLRAIQTMFSQEELQKQSSYHRLLADVGSG